MLLFACKKSEAPAPVWEASISEQTAPTLVGILQANRQGTTAAIANQVASYFYRTQGFDLRQQFRDNPDGLVILGTFYAAKETYDLRQRTMRTEGDWSCFWTAVGDVLGLAQARSIWGMITGGSYTGSVLRVLSTMATRVAGVFTVAMMVYSTGECLGWW
jgi:hypothetical protein